MPRTGEQSPLVRRFSIMVKCSPPHLRRPVAAAQPPPQRVRCMLGREVRQQPEGFLCECLSPGDRWLQAQGSQRPKCQSTVLCTRSQVHALAKCDGCKHACIVHCLTCSTAQHGRFSKSVQVRHLPQMAITKPVFRCIDPDLCIEVRECCEGGVEVGASPERADPGLEMRECPQDVGQLLRVQANMHCVTDVAYLSCRDERESTIPGHASHQATTRLQELLSWKDSRESSLTCAECWWQHQRPKAPEAHGGSAGNHKTDLWLEARQQLTCVGCECIQPCLCWLVLQHHQSPQRVAHILHGTIHIQVHKRSLRGSVPTLHWSTTPSPGTVSRRETA